MLTTFSFPPLLFSFLLEIHAWPSKFANQPFKLFFFWFHPFFFYFFNRFLKFDFVFNFILLQVFNLSNSVSILLIFLFMIFIIFFYFSISSSFFFFIFFIFNALFFSI
jgi:hypothetical protein